MGEILVLILCFPLKMRAKSLGEYVVDEGEFLLAKWRCMQGSEAVLELVDGAGTDDYRCHLVAAQQPCGGYLGGVLFLYTPEEL